MVEKDGLTQEIPWAKVQRLVGQLVMQDKFFVTDATERYTVEQTSDAWEQPFIVRDNTIPDSDKDRYHHTEDTYLTYDTEEEAQAAADRLNGTEQQAAMELAFEMYDTENPDIFKVKENSYLVSAEVNAPQEIWERFALKGLAPKEVFLSLPQGLFPCTKTKENPLQIALLTVPTMRKILTKQRTVSCYPLTNVTLKPCKPSLCSLSGNMMILQAENKQAMSLPIRYGNPLSRGK